MPDSASAPGGELGRQVFDESHYAATFLRKIQRSLQLGIRYYAWDLPRYFRNRRALHLPLFDGATLWNPLREFRGSPFCQLPLPPHYEEALEQFRDHGIQLTMPRVRLEALLGLWWSVRAVPGRVIECGSYKGATGLLLALLGRLNDLDQRTLLLDTFHGIPQTSRFDVSRGQGEFVPPEDQVGAIRRQATVLGIAERVDVYQGLFADTFVALEPSKPTFALVHVDANIYQGTYEACTFTIPRLAPGGVVILDDYNGSCDLGARLAIEHFRNGKYPRPSPLATTSAYWRLGEAAPTERPP